MKRGKAFYTGIGLILAFILWTILIQRYDVQAVGPEGTEVGFASWNVRFHQLTGVNMTLYTVTDWLGLVPVFICGCFGIIGLSQWIRRKRILRVDPDIDIALPEWEWNGTEAVFILPNGTRVNAETESEISADGKSITYTATALLREVPFSDSRTFCLVTFSGADVPAQAVSEGSYAVWPGEPIVAGSVFDGWYTDAECTEEYAFGTAVTEGLTIYAGWTTPAPSGFIKLPAILSRIESEAFAGISAQAVIVPGTVTDIAYDAFSLSGVRYIYGFPETAAEHFADTYGYTFVPIDDDWMAIH